MSGKAAPSANAFLMIAWSLELPLWSAAVAVIGTFAGATVGLSNRWRCWCWRARWTQAHPRGDGGHMQAKLFDHIVALRPACTSSMSC